MECSLGWDGAALVAVDQVALPAEHRTLRLTTVDEVIGSLAIRGAPAIGVAGGLTVLVTAIVTERRTLCPASGAEFATTARALYDRGWMEGTAGNLSTRLPGTPGHALITVVLCRR